MVLLDGNGQKWALHFFHTTEPQEGPGPVVRQPRRLAYCTLHPGDCARPQRPCETPGAAVGMAACYFKDEFSRRVGRRVALTRAMTELGLPREVRVDLWEKYLTKTGVPHGPRP